MFLLIRTILKIDLNYMLKDCNCKIVIDEEELEKFKAVKEKYSKENHRPPVTTDNLAYVIYTSGSTGQPKGVMIEIGSLVCEMYYLDKVYAFDTSDRALFYRSFSFDSAMEEYLYPFTAGARCYIAPSNFRDNIIENAIHEINTNGITKFNMPSILLCELVSYLNQHPEISFPSLKHVITGGDVLTNEIAAQAIDLFAPATFHNAYGPSENTNDSAQIVLTEVKKDDVIPIGKSIPNSISYILDSKLQLLPKGVVGELYFSGPGLARGYLNKPELSAERFLPSPFKEGERIYKSGDLGRWLSGGRIDFLGRIDNQVKIRGYRVELGEIQELLIKHNSIDDAAVITWTGSNGPEKVLVAYIVSKDQLDTSEIKSYLKESLPDYMIPAFFVQLDRLPSNPNGKLDRKALPDPLVAESNRNTEYVAPRNEWEEQLIPIWEEVLGKSNIGATEDFFELGGHSLKVIHLINAYHKVFEVKPNIKDLFTHTRLDAHARLISQSSQTRFSAIDPVPPTSEGYDLSSEQRRLWIICQFEERSTAYNIPFTAPLNGITNIQFIEKAVYSLLDRHEVLRTVFKEDGTGTVKQWVLSAEELKLDIQHIDFSGHPHKQEQLLTYIKEDSFRPFDLEKGPLIRVALIRMDEQAYVFYFNIHHIISDGYSMEILSKEMLAFYEAHRVNKQAKLSPLHIHYKDYAAWQQKQLKNDTYKNQKEYWLNKLAGTLPPIDLPIAKSRPLVKSNNGHRIGIYFEKKISQAFKQFCSDQEGTLFMGILSLLNSLLFRYTGQSDLIIGTPVSGRTHIDLKDQIGFYLNTLALRSQLKGEDSFIELFQKTKATCLEAFEHQLYPFDKLVEELEVERDMSRNAVFDIILTLQNTEQISPDHIEEETHELDQIIDYGPGASKFDLDFSFEEHGEHLFLSLEYNTDLYEKQAIERFCRHFQQLLSSALAQSDQSIDQLDYLSEQEKHQLLIQFNDTSFSYPEGQTIISLFEQQVVKTPDYPALSFEQTTLSYHQLNEKANQLASYLIQTYQIQSEKLIAVLLDRSEWMIVSILAILKTGGAYLPIDPSYPKARIQYLLDDSQCRVIIDEKELASFKKKAKQYDTGNQSVEVTPQNLAYLMYTSGSTGQPNGVMIEHKNVVSLIKSCTYVELTSDRRILSTGSFSFDATTFEYWASLLNGGHLIICPQAVLLDSQELEKELKDKAVDTLWCTAGWFSQLVEENIALFSGLNYLLVGGDRLSPFHINKVRRKYAGLEIINGYGPTENTTFSTTFSIQQAMENIPIGFPVSDGKVYILDTALQPVPIGINGEIYLTGEGLTRGYLNRVDLNADKFIPSPFEENVKLYRSGDIGKWLPDGSIDFIGRKDEQIKIRGFRIEPGEVKAILLQQDLVEDAEVIIKAVNSGEKEIHAYIVSREASDLIKIKEALLAEMPSYMIPTAFFHLDKMPLTPNGKLDRKALRELKKEKSTERSFVAPSDEMEITLANIWQKILQRDRISLQDNFFDLGGHSLKVMALVNAYHKSFGVKLKVKDLFSRTTLESHRQLIESSSKADYHAIQPIGERKNYLLSSAQRRLWILSQFKGGSTAYNVPFTARLKSTLNLSVLELSMNALIERHEILRTVFKNDTSGEIRQWILDKSAISFPLEVLDLSQEPAPSDMIENYLQNDMRKAFDLEKGPLLRGAVIKLAEEEFIVYFNMHHIISDGWSIQVLYQDLSAFYQAFLAGIEAVLPPLKIQYKDYAAWQQAQLEGEIYQQHRAFWLNKLAGNLPRLDLPLAKNRPAMRTSNGHRLGIYFSKQQSNALRSFCREREGTLFMGLVAILKVLLHQYTTQTDIVIGTPISGRNHSDLDHQIGFYLNILALRTELNPNDNFNTFFDKIKSMTLEAYHHQTYPFDQLVDELNLKRDTSRNAVFDFMLTLQTTDHIQAGRHSDEVNFDQIIDYGPGPTKFEVDLNFQEIEDTLFLSLEYNTDVYEKDTAERLIRHFQQLLIRLTAAPEQKINQVVHLTEDEQKELLLVFNDTLTPYPKDKTIINLFEEQSLRTPDEIAVVFGETQITYRQLNEQSNQLANYLKQTYEIKSEDLIAIHLERSDRLLVALLGILKSGGAYVPIDPLYPEERINYILKDSQAKLILDQKELDRFSTKANVYAKDNLEADYGPGNLAYVIYTSGSTGRPKGVLIEHRNVVNFFTGMSQQFKDAGPGHSLLAVTTISFDISVLELLWTLSRGLKVIIQPDHRIEQFRSKDLPLVSAKKLDFSLFYFASEVQDTQKYKLLIEGARFADQNGFSALWTPERHFHEFGGIFPNPAVTSAAIAAITENVKIRSGSCVLPLHNPIRVAEEWSVVDNLSNGRVGLSFASGWVLDDFLAFAPEDFSNRHQKLYEGIETVRDLWRGDSISLKNDRGEDSQITIYPTPVQKELPIWVTSGGNVETFKTAGEIGANLLTHLIGQTVEELEEKIKVYRQARKKAGHKGKGQVSLMIHTYLGNSVEEVKEIVRVPFSNYLKSSLGLLKNLIKTLDHDVKELNNENLDAIVEYAFNRYFDTSALFGTIESCLPLLNKLSLAGVDEIGCLIDFGVKTDLVIKGFDQINMLKDQYKDQSKHWSSLSEIVDKHKISHLQCTPSLMKMMLMEAEAEQHMQSLTHILLGGEKLPFHLAEQIKGLPNNPELYNMYGPTETTIWSASSLIKASDTKITIGRPISNTRIYILGEDYNLKGIGEIGELCIGGDGLARSYLNRPDLTAEKFVEDPFLPGQRIYKTGDLCRWLPDGSIDFISRKDEQIKIRGYRVELGEIEYSLLAIDGVREAVVTVVERPSAEPQLVSYIVADNELTNASLRAELKKTLPPYMLPDLFVQLEQMPLTANGKIDKKALPTPALLALSGEAAYEAPRNPAEKKLVKIWSELLLVERIGIADNFFELGGHSLLAIKLIARMNKVFSTQLQLNVLFESPTIKQLGNKVSSSIESAADQSFLIDINPTGDQSPLFCVPGAGGHVTSYYDLSKALGKEQPFYAFQSPGLDGKSSILTSVEEMAALYIKEMQKIDPEGPYHLGGYSFGADVAFEIALQLNQAGFKVNNLFVFDSVAPHTNDNKNVDIEVRAFYKWLLNDLIGGPSLPDVNERLSLEEFLNYSLEEKINWAFDKLVNTEWSEISRVQFRRIVEVTVSNLSCLYTPKLDNAFELPILLFKASERTAEEEEMYPAFKTPEYGWEELTTSTVKSVIAEGNHHTFLGHLGKSKRATGIIKNRIGKR